MDLQQADPDVPYRGWQRPGSCALDGRAAARRKLLVLPSSHSLTLKPALSPPGCSLPVPLQGIRP